MTEAPSTSDNHELLITRDFDAPRELVYQAWTNPEFMKPWWGGFEGAIWDGDVRPGGAWRSRITSTDGSDFWASGSYREIVPPERLVFTYRGKIPGSDELTATVTFEEDGGKTRMFFRMSGFGSKEARDGHRGGFTECFDALEASLTGDRNPRIHHAS